MKYAFVAEHCRDYPVTVMCCVLEVSVSGYYAWCKREPSQHSREDAALAAKVEAAFENNRRVYGSPRIHAELQAQGILCGQKRVARLMRELGISAQRPKHRTITTHSEKGVPVAANLQRARLSCRSSQSEVDHRYHVHLDPGGVALSRCGA